MSRYKRYEKYKDSGVEWIGEIPEHWEVSKLKYLTYCLDGKRIPLSSEQRGEMQGDIPYWGANCIIDYVNDWLIDGEVVLLGEDGAPFFDKYKDVAFYSNGRIWPNNHVHVLRALQSINAKLLTYILNTVDYSNYIKGSTRDKLTQAEMKNIFIQLLPVREQKAIVNFLDQKTAVIDDLIADKEKLIELLQEKRQAVITEAVTKGLDPNVKMKDSGVEWIGEIPEHWEIGRLKNSIKSCRNGIWGDEPQGDINDVACIRVVDFNRTNMEIEVNNLTIRNVPVSKQKMYLLKRGDLLIEKSGGGEKQPVGFVTIFNHDIPAVYANFIARMELEEKVYSGFYKYVHYAMYSVRLNVKSIKQTTGIQNLDINYYFEERVIYPPLNEQKIIANFLDQKTAEIDSLVTETKNQIEKLKEYRQSLIFEAVTGKIDVRDYVID